MQINSVVIVGGGSSGWFTASALNKHCPELDVTLIESPNVPTIGVGESTIQAINRFFLGLEMKDEDWMPHCDAVYKGSIQFTDFYQKGEAFHYPFGPMDFQVSQYGTDDWFFKKWLYPDTPQTDFCDTYWPAMPLINKNKINFNEDGLIPNFSLDRDWAYQFDALKLAHWMRDNLCSTTTHILDHVTEINLDERGWISSVSTQKSGELKADLYVDCTGFKALLLEKVGVSYTSYQDLLINNAAWASRVPYDDPSTEIDLVTDCRGIDNGWVWNTPLWSRIGTGYVYSDKFIDKEDALKEFKQHLNENNPWARKHNAENLEFNHIDIKNGVHDKAWHKNCIALGLSYGFIEPLESTGLVFLHEGIDKLVVALQTRDRHITQFDRDCVNRENRIQLDYTKYFVGFHFYGGIRDDSEYWRYYTQELEQEDHWIDSPNDMLSFITVRKDEPQGLSRARFTMFDSRAFTDGTLCVAVGHHMNLYTDYIRQKLAHQDWSAWSNNKNRFKSDLKDVFRYWWDRNERINKLADNSPTHYEYLKENIYEV